MESKRASKRIVSKGQYTANVGKKAAHSSLGIGLLLLGGIGLTVLGLVLLLTLWMITMRFEAEILFILAIIVPTLGIGSWYVLQIGLRTCREAANMDAGVPLTRANTADLPAPDSLVRASQEPVQTQEAVLLRAAIEGQERHEEQLLRASTGE